MCTEPKEQPQEALRFAIAFEKGISQQKSFEGNTNIENEPVYAIDNKNKNPVTRCGLEIVTNHLAASMAKNEKCRNCGIIGIFQRMCKRPKTANFRGNGRSSNRGGMRRINLHGQTTDQPEESSEWEEENAVFQLNGTGVTPFMLKCRINIHVGDDRLRTTNHVFYERRREETIEK